MRHSILAIALGMCAATVAVTPASAASIVNNTQTNSITGITQRTLASGDNLNNNSYAGTVYLFFEGLNNGYYSYLLHYDRRLFPNDPESVSGSFGILLAAGETFSSTADVFRTTAELNASDPSRQGVTYSSNVFRGLESNSLAIVNDTVTTTMPNPVNVAFTFNTVAGSVDEARFRIRAAVPEPATWAMMLLGFGMVGAASRYRRKGMNVTYA